MTRRSWTRRTYRQVDGLPAYDDDELARDADAQYLADVRLLAVDSTDTALAITRRAAITHGTTPAQIQRWLEDEEARVREEMKS